MSQTAARYSCSADTATISTATIAARGATCAAWTAEQVRQAGTPVDDLEPVLEPGALLLTAIALDEGALIALDDGGPALTVCLTRSTKGAELDPSAAVIWKVNVVTVPSAPPRVTVLAAPLRTDRPLNAGLMTAPAAGVMVNDRVGTTAGRWNSALYQLAAPPKPYLRAKQWTHIDRQEGPRVEWCYAAIPCSPLFSCPSAPTHHTPELGSTHTCVKTAVGSYAMRRPFGPG